MLWLWSFDAEHDIVISEEKKVPDIRAIVILLLLISHQTFIHISLRRDNVLDSTDISFVICILILFST